jgi:hypothetical protein
MIIVKICTHTRPSNFFTSCPSFPRPTDVFLKTLSGPLHPHARGDLIPPVKNTGVFLYSSTAQYIYMYKWTLKQITPVFSDVYKTKHFPRGTFKTCQTQMTPSSARTHTTRAYIIKHGWGELIEMVQRSERSRCRVHETTTTETITAGTHILCVFRYLGTCVMFLINEKTLLCGVLT